MDTVVNGTAKAWVNFNGAGVVAIRRAFGVSSITDNGAGDYTINFTTAMTDGYYATIGTSGSSTTSLVSVAQPQALTAPTTVAVRVQTTYANGSLVDAPSTSVTIFS